MRTHVRSNAASTRIPLPYTPLHSTPTPAPPPQHQPEALRSPPGASRLDVFANDVLARPAAPMGRHRRHRSGQMHDVYGGNQKVGVSTVDLTPKGARAQISQGVGGGANARTPNTKGLAICTSPAAFPPWNGPTSEHPALVGMRMIASPCSRLVMDKFGPHSGLTRDDSGIGLASPMRHDDDKDVMPIAGRHFGRNRGIRGLSFAEDFRGTLLSDYKADNKQKDLSFLGSHEPSAARNRKGRPELGGGGGGVDSFQQRFRGRGGGVGGGVGDSGLGSEIPWEIEPVAFQMPVETLNPKP
jgi:hypothetical protein